MTLISNSPKREAPLAATLPHVPTSPPAPRRRQRLAPGTFFNYTVAGVALVVYLFPILYLLNVSLKTLPDYYHDPSSITHTLALGNFSAAWSQGNFSTYFGNSLLYTIASTALCIVLSLFVAFPIARGYIKWSNLWYTLFVIALFLPVGIIAQFQLILHLGLYDTQLGYILSTANLGITPLLMVSYFRSLPKELDEAAAIDGCSYFRYVLSIVVPLSRPVLVTAIILHAINVWNDIIGPTIYLSDQSYYPVSLGLFSFLGQYSSNWVQLAAATVIMAAPLVVVFVLLQRYFIAGAIAGAVKS